MKLTIAQQCKESGHWWGDEPFILKTWKRQQVGERVQKCQRGCGRERTLRISARTGEVVGGYVYGGNLSRSADKATLRQVSLRG